MLGLAGDGGQGAAGQSAQKWEKGRAVLRHRVENSMRQVRRQKRCDDEGDALATCITRDSSDSAQNEQRHIDDEVEPGTTRRMVGIPECAHLVEDTGQPPSRLCPDPREGEPSRLCIVPRARRYHLNAIARSHFIDDAEDVGLEQITRLRVVEKRSPQEGDTST